MEFNKDTKIDIKKLNQRINQVINKEEILCPCCKEGLMILKKETKDTYQIGCTHCDMYLEVNK